MIRLPRMRKYKTVTPIFLGALLTVVYLWKSSSDLNTMTLQTCVRNSSQMKTNTRINSRRKTYQSCQQNLTNVNVTVFESFSNELKDFLRYGHCRHFPMLLDIPDKCGGAENSKDIFLLLVIKSPPPNFDRREVLRKTWAQERLHNGMWIRRLFISGTINTGFDKERMNQLLKLEHQRYNDILQWDFNESFFNLTLKQVLFLEWMEQNCQGARFMLNGDDDIFAHTDNMVEYLQSLEDNDGSKHLFTGYVFTDGTPVRWPESKYYVPLEVYEPELYPPYVSGGGILMSVYTALVIYTMSKTITIMPIDDAYMGMCLVKAGLEPVSHMGMMTLGWKIPSTTKDQYDPCFFKEILLVHRLLPADLYVMWHRINEPNLDCGITKKWLTKNPSGMFEW